MLKSSHTYSKNSCTIHCPPGRAGRALNNITAAALCTGLTECGGILKEMRSANTDYFSGKVGIPSPATLESNIKQTFL